MEGFASFASFSSGFRVRDALTASTAKKGRYAMKSRFSTCIPAMMLFAALAIPVRLATQDRPDHRSNHYHYKLIDMGTFGGPNSYFNSLSLTDAGFGFGTVFYNNALIGNRRGVFVGFADTSTPDPYPAFCYTPHCFVAHPFQWRHGIKTDLGSLPGGASSAAFWINQRGWVAGNYGNGKPIHIYPRS